MIWLAVLFGFCVAFVFSGIEAGILSIDRVRLRHRARRHDARAAKLERLLANPERLLAMVLIVTNFANVTAFALCVHKGVRAFGDSGYFWVSLIYLPVYLIGIELLIVNCQGCNGGQGTSFARSGTRPDEKMLLRSSASKLLFGIETYPDCRQAQCNFALEQRREFYRVKPALIGYCTM